MSVTKKLKMEYFRVVCRRRNSSKEEPDILFDLTKWINKIDSIDLSKRIVTYREDKARLDKLKYDKENNYWHLNFLKLRETNIPNKAKINSEAEPIPLEDDEYIGEDVNALYDEELYILVLQKNKYSLSFSVIEDYLNEIWKQDEDLDIFLRPILPQDAFASIENKGTYRKLNVKFDNVRYSHFAGEAGSTLKDIYESIGSYGCINAEITMTMGYYKNDYLDNATITETIKDVRNNKNIISKAEISYKDEIDDRIEIVDLFADKWHDFIFLTIERRESILASYVFSKMVEKYNEGREHLKTVIEK